MFERYTERSRRVIFFARYEALQYGSPVIAPEHILLGLVREDKTITNRFFPFRHNLNADSIRKEIEEDQNMALGIIIASIIIGIALIVSAAVHG